MFGLKTHHGAIDGTDFLKVDKIGTLFHARVRFKGYDVSIDIGAAIFEKYGHSQNITESMKEDIF